MNRRRIATVGWLIAGCTFAATAAELGRSKPQIVNNIKPGGASNPTTGLQLALFAPVQMFPPRYDVSGFRLSLLYGRNQNLRGFDLGAVNVVEGVAEGLQLGLAVNRAGSVSGAQIAAFNDAGESENGCFQMGAVNKAGEFYGCQLGLVNLADHVDGVQIGFVNVCQTMSGIQLGFANIISRSDALVFCPLFNAQF
ncbi:MAG: hypothetical protein FJ221_09995 [Lentisphaerae bacterium]|nr:hypothetical protein [Lentisphaerota bacterium]